MILTVTQKNIFRWRNLLYEVTLPAAQKANKEL
jgi:hypothetical protein